MKNYQTAVATWLEQLGKEKNGTLLLDDSGHCVIPVNGDLLCIVEVPDNDEAAAVFIYLPLLELPQQSAAQFELISKALELNLFGILTAGCHVALDPRSKHIVISFSSPVQMLDAAIFRQVIDTMIALAPTLLDLLQGSRQRSSAADSLSGTSAAFISQQHLKRFQLSTQARPDQ